KQHCSFGFWKGALVVGSKKGYGNTQDGAMGQFGRITSLSDLPPDNVLVSHIKQAARLNDEGIKRPSKPAQTKELVIPNDLIAALKKNKSAQATFDQFS